jgi:hypothetical protein
MEMLTMTQEEQDIASEIGGPAPTNREHPADRPQAGPSRKWLVYEEAALYIGWSVRYLRNLVSADQIPVYGPLRSRRFRVDMLDLFLTNRDAAMRKFLAERSSHHGD